MRIAVMVKGGVVQMVFADKKVDVLVVDQDGREESNAMKFPYFGSDETFNAEGLEPETFVDREYVEACFKAAKA